MIIYSKHSMRFLCASLLAVSAIVPVCAQDETPAPDINAPAATTPETNANETNATSTKENAQGVKPEGEESKPKIIEPTINEGELRVDGTVNFIGGADSFKINVTSFTTSKGKTVELEAPKPKAITSDASTSFYARGENDKKLAFSDIKLGMRLSIVGKDLGSGKPMPAREIVLWIEQNREGKTLGTVRVEYEVGKLIDRGDEARQVRDLTNALRFFNRAVEQAVGMGDRSGQALALGRSAGIHADMGQYDQALSLYERSLPLWRSVGNSDSEATSLNNMGLVYRRKDDNEKAVEALERAVALLRNSRQKKAIVLTWGNLASAYIAAEKYEEALRTYEQLLPMVSTTAEKSEHVEALSEMAYVYGRLEQADKAQAYAAQAAQFIESVSDKPAKARALYTLGLVYHNTGMPEEGLKYYTQALALYQQQGDAEGTQRVSSAIEALKKNLEEQAAN